MNKTVTKIPNAHTGLIISIIPDFSDKIKFFMLLQFYKTMNYCYSSRTVFNKIIRDTKALALKNPKLVITQPNKSVGKFFLIITVSLCPHFSPHSLPPPLLSPPRENDSAMQIKLLYIEGEKLAERINASYTFHRGNEANRQIPCGNIREAI